MSKTTFLRVQTENIRATRPFFIQPYQFVASGSVSVCKGAHHTGDPLGTSM